MHRSKLEKKKQVQENISKLNQNDNVFPGSNSLSVTFCYPKNWLVVTFDLSSITLVKATWLINKDHNGNPTLLSLNRCGSACARAFAPQAEGWVFESQPRKNLAVKTSNDSSTAKRLAIGVSVTVGVARYRILTAQWPWVPSTGQTLKSFTDNGDISIWVKNYRVGRKTSNNLQ